MRTDELIRDRLLARLDAPFRLTILEALTGAGRATLLRQWVAREETSQGRRVLIEFDPEQDGPGMHLVQTLMAVAQAGVPVDREALAALTRNRDRSRLRELATAVLDPVTMPLTLVYPVWDQARQSLTEPEIATLFRDQPMLSVMVATVDGDAIATFAAAVGVAYQRLNEDDLYFNRDEIDELLSARAAQEGLSIREGAVDNLLAASHGNPAVTMALLQERPQLCADGVATRAQGVRLLESSQRWRDADGTLPLFAFMRATIYAPRFNLGIGSELSPGLDVHHLMERLRRARLGIVEVGAQHGIETFVWDVDVRARVIEVFAAREVFSAGREAFASTSSMRTVASRAGGATRVGAGEDQARSAHLAVAAAAALHGDYELEVNSRLSADDLDGAEACAQRWLWEMLASVATEMWKPLMSIAASRLTRQPTLAFLREIFSRRGVVTTVRDDARTLALARAQAALPAADPRSRLASLARAAFAACEGGDLALGHELTQRWLELSADTRRALVAEPSHAVVANALLVAQVLTQLDLYAPAREVWSLVLELQEELGEPDGSGALSAHAALAGTGVLAGLPHRPMGGEDLLERVPADSTRAFDLVMYGVARGWEAMDAGRIDEAADVTAHALARLARPENWPVLLLTHVIALAAAGRSQELETIRLRYLQSATRYARHRSTHWMGPTADFLEVFTSRYVGGPTPGPPDGAPTPVDSRFSFVTVAVTAHDSAPGDVERGASLPDGEGLAKLSLRMRGAVLQVVAIEAMRSDGGEEVALAALRRCYAELGADQLAPIGLALGSREAIDKLCALVRAQPAELGLNRALGAERFAGVPWSEAPPVELSEREAEILAHIREGRSNSVIAKNLYVTVNTVKFHRSNLFRKLGATNRDEAVAASLRLGL